MVLPETIFIIEIAMHRYPMKLVRQSSTQAARWLIFLLLLFTLLRIPSLFEPSWYGDEGIYQVIGTGIHQGRLLYSGIWDNKPPFLFFIYSFVL